VACLDEAKLDGAVADRMRVRRRSAAAGQPERLSLREAQVVSIPE